MRSFHIILFFRRRAPRQRDKMGFGRLVVVLHSPQCLVLSSSGTTSSGQNGASTGWSWCFALPNALFFRRRAPRQRVPLNKKPTSGKQSPFKLTLMKGDEVVELLQVIAQNSLLGYTWNSYNCVSHKFFIKVIYCAACSK